MAHLQNNWFIVQFNLDHYDLEHFHFDRHREDVILAMNCNSGWYMNNC